MMEEGGRVRVKPKWDKGQCTYDVHTEGGGGVEPKEDVVRAAA